MPAPNARRYNYYDKSEMPVAPPEPPPPPISSDIQVIKADSRGCLCVYSEYLILLIFLSQMDSMWSGLSDAKQAAEQFLPSPSLRMPPLPSAP